MHNLAQFPPRRRRMNCTQFLIKNRDGKLRQSLVHRMDEVEQQLKLESQQRVDNEKESRLAVEESTNKMKNFSDENAETVRKLLSVR